MLDLLFPLDNIHVLYTLPGPVLGSNFAGLELVSTTGHILVVVPRSGMVLVF